MQIAISPGFLVSLNVANAGVAVEVPTLKYRRTVGTGNPCEIRCLVFHVLKLLKIAVCVSASPLFAVSGCFRFPSPTPDSSSTYEASEVSYCPLKQWRTNLHRAENNAKNPFGKMGPMPTNARRWRKLISLHLGFLS